MMSKHGNAFPLGWESTGPGDASGQGISSYGIAPDSKVHGANMGPIWGRQDPDGPHVGPMNLAIWDYICPKYSCVSNNCTVKTKAKKNVL